MSTKSTGIDVFPPKKPIYHTDAENRQYITDIQKKSSDLLQKLKSIFFNDLSRILPIQFLKKDLQHFKSESTE